MEGCETCKRKREREDGRKESSNENWSPQKRVCACCVSMMFGNIMFEDIFKPTIFIEQRTSRHNSCDVPKCYCSILLRMTKPLSHV